MSKFWMILTMIPTAGACAGDPGTRPHDMSAAQHQSAASQEEGRAAGHGAQYDPGATKDSTICGQAGTIRPSTEETGPPCWTSRSNPTAQHSQDAQRYRELAAKHRAASAALVQAEQKACAGIDEADRDASPFYHREDILSVGNAEVKPADSYVAQPAQTVGAVAVFRAIPGLTAEWLQHEMNCHIARAAAVGHEMPEMSYCPLVLKGVRATVSSTGEGFAVRVTSDDKQTVQEILRRTRALASTAK